MARTFSVIHREPVIFKITDVASYFDNFLIIVQIEVVRKTINKAKDRKFYRRHLGDNV